MPTWRIGARATLLLASCLSLAGAEEAATDWPAEIRRLRSGAPDEKKASRERIAATICSGNVLPLMRAIARLTGGRMGNL